MKQGLSWRYLAPLLLVLVFSFLTERSVWAHAWLVKSEPEAGTMLRQESSRVTAWFSQELESSSSRLQVFNATGEQVDKGNGGVDLYDPDHISMAVNLPVSLPSGLYVVRWTAVSIDDGDTTSGEFTFGIGESEMVLNQVPVEKPASARPDLGRLLGPLGIGIGLLLLVITGSLIHRRSMVKEG